MQTKDTKSVSEYWRKCELDERNYSDEIPALRPPTLNVRFCFGFGCSDSSVDLHRYALYCSEQARREVYTIPMVQLGGFRSEIERFSFECPKVMFLTYYSFNLHDWLKKKPATFSSNQKQDVPRPIMTRQYTFFRPSHYLTLTREITLLFVWRHSKTALTVFLFHS